MWSARGQGGETPREAHLQIEERSAARGTGDEFGLGVSHARALQKREGRVADIAEGQGRFREGSGKVQGRPTCRSAKAVSRT